MPAAEDLLQRSVAWMDRYWDAERSLLWEMGEVADAAGSTHAPYHVVRESAWYALGLLMRDQPGDAERALQALGAVLACQFDEPGRIYHGAFRRAPEEPHPLEYAPDGRVLIWEHYDPNWREFIMTTLAVILDEFEDWLPASLIEKIEAALRKAVAGTLARGLAARYTNIALMQAALLTWAGARLNEPEWVSAGEAMGSEVYDLFKVHDAFEEYNSPTYYGVNLYALRLWQLHARSPRLAALGSEMEALLWRDVSQLYHAGLKNLAGPYDRSYGMDMTRYVAVLGAWIWLVTGREAAPFPDVTDSFSHAGDFCFGPLVALLGASVPEDVLLHFTAFQGERLIERTIGDSPNEGRTGRSRTVTAWLGERVMIGGQHTSLSDIGQGQFHPATIHWRLPHTDDRVGWVRLRAADPVDAVAGPLRLAVTGLGPLTFEIDAPDIAAERITSHAWELPGLVVRVQTDGTGSVEVSGEHALVRYVGEHVQEVRVVLELAE